jgi:RimJ/RimL family protein N-acetyltransferase
MAGRYCRVEPIDPTRHARDLFDANALDPSNANFTYLSIGPFDDFAAYRDWMASAVKSEDPLFHVIVDAATGKAVGLATYMRLDPGNGVIEVGHRIFEMGYRRYEWKCDSLNAASRAAAQRLGFSYEGIFRQAGVYKGRGRDTAWYAMIDSEWPDLERAFQRWLDPANFDARGNQRLRLSDLTAPVLKQRG